jgi:hypothetical protein
MNMGILSNEREYKHELFLKSKPDIMAIGSSRILQIRQDMFDRSFINMGRGLDMSNLRNDLPSLLDHHQPKFILFGFDYWLFSKERVDGDQSGKQRKAMIRNANAGSGNFNVIPRTVLTPWQWLASGKITPSEIVSLFFTGNVREGPRIGFQAIVSNNGGYAPDGSYYYLSVYEPSPTAHCDLARNVKIYTGRNRAYGLPSDTSVSETQFRNLQSVVAEIKKRNIIAIAFLPPVHAELYEMLINQENYKEYTRVVRYRLESLFSEFGIPFFDFLDPEKLGSSSSEFFDAIHPGEIATARMISKMSNAFPTNPLRIRKEDMNDIILRYSGKPTVASAFIERFGLKLNNKFQNNGSCD